ncbi:MAG TPA: winged helix-turn-helix domain-containing protein [Burkholderiales bacterium]|jgi:predicted CopG family antitoxin|nr:winged helix-turn-helix domain-containing protein [Burkholderiales bacterium]
MPTIRIDDEVFAGLKKLAEPLVDTPNAVIRRLLEEKGLVQARHPAPPSKVSKKKEQSEKPFPEQTPQSVYEENLLAVLADQFGGRGSKKDVTLAVVERMMKRGLIPPGDLEFVATGETKAENKISWGRNALKERGLIRGDAPRGVWELTPEGRATSRSARRP